MRRREFLASATLLTASAARAQQNRRTKHIVLFTSDGVRWQDLFNGIDPLLMNEKAAGMKDADGLRKKLWRETPEARRSALMPFFWGTLVPKGVLLKMQVSNRYRVSYPGYSEILTGRTQDEVIKGNDPVQNPTPSFLQFLKDRQHLRREQVAVFASWERFHEIAESRRGEIFINAGYEMSALPANSAKTDLLNRLQFEARFTDDSSRHDAFTFGLASEYLERIQPEHLYISFDETDDWAHGKRYDQVLQSLDYFDTALKSLWNALQSSSKYRDATTLVVTTDHGRGSTLGDWSDHGPKVPGDEQIWALFVGPDTPSRGHLANPPLRYQRDIAPTILSLLGIPVSDLRGVKGSVIAEAVR